VLGAVPTSPVETDARRGVGRELPSILQLPRHLRLTERSRQATPILRTQAASRAIGREERAEPAVDGCPAVKVN